jgi:hypothetical protein
MVTEAALSHVRNGKAVMQLDERLVGRSGAASVIEDRDRPASQEQGRHQEISQSYIGLRSTQPQYLSTPGGQQRSMSMRQSARGALALP